METKLNLSETRIRSMIREKDQTLRGFAFECGFSPERLSCVLTGLHHGYPVTETTARHGFRIYASALVPEESREYTATLKEGETTTRRIRLGTGLRISGHVTCADQPVKESSLSLKIEEPRFYTSTRTDENGFFEFVDITPGNATIYVGSYFPTAEMKKTLLVESDVTDLEFPLPSGRISVTILNVRGKSVGRSAQLTCLANEDGTESTRSAKRTAYNGRTVFEYLTNGRYRLEAVDQREVTVTSEPIEITEGASMHNIELREKAER